MTISTRMLGRRGAIAALALLAVATTAVAAPQGPPIRIGGTLALTGPLAPTALIHKLAGELYVEELNKANGLLGRPVEWVLLDDQSKPDLTRSLYEKLITVDKVDLIIGPYATGAILAGMGVAQRYQKMYVHHSFGMPHLAKYDMHFPTAAFGPEPARTVPTVVFERSRRRRSRPRRWRSSPASSPRRSSSPRGPRTSRRSAGSRWCCTSSTSSARATSGRWRPGSRTRSPISSGWARSASTATSSSRR